MALPALAAASADVWPLNTGLPIFDLWSAMPFICLSRDSIILLISPVGPSEPQPIMESPKLTTSKEKTNCVFFIFEFWETL